MAIPTSIKTLLSGDVVEWARIEIVSFLGPDRSVTQEGLKRYRVSNRRYRTRRFGDEKGSPKPEFETDDDPRYFISRLFVQEAFLKEENTQAGTEKEPKRSQKKEPKKGAEKKLDVLRRMEENPMITQVKLMEEFNLTREQVQKLIKDLREDGLIERQGSNRSGKWVVKK